MKSIGDSLDARGGVGPGFDTIRVILALGVVAQHCWPATDGQTGAPDHGHWWALAYAVVPMFFALSGFLVTGSAMRLRLGRFAANRALRIFPALIVDTAVSVLVLGVAFTTLSPLAFLAHPMTLAYWLNCLGEIHYFLPGVFTTNPTSVVNASLWTIPAELCCYISLTVMIITRSLKWWPVPLLGVLVIFGVDLAFRQFGGRFPHERQLAGDSGKLIAIFLLGSLAFTQRHRIPDSAVLAALAALFIALCAAFGSVAWRADPAFQAGGSLASAYLVIWLGLRPLPLPWPFRTGDYSYGVYLYGFPIQQAVVHLTGTRSPWLDMALSIPLVLAVAALSWHLVEKPSLRLRKGFSVAAKIEAARSGEGAATARL